MKTLKVVLNQAGQTDEETLRDIYALIPNPSFRNPRTIRALFNNALKVLRDWKSSIYECEFAGSLFIFCQDKRVLDSYRPHRREAQAEPNTIQP